MTTTSSTLSSAEQAAADALFREQVQSLISQQLANAGKLQAEQQKLQREAKWYPVIALAAFAASVAAVGKLFYGP